MAWYVRHAHMCGSTLMLQGQAVYVEENGQLPTNLSEEQVARCQMFPDVFRFEQDPEPSTPEPSIPEPSEPVAPLLPELQLPEPEELAPAPAPEPKTPSLLSTFGRKGKKK